MNSENRTMFNSPIKEKYLKIDVKNAKGLSNFFKRVYRCDEFGERAVGKDIADFALEEWESLIIALNLRSERSKAQFIGLIRPYVKWYHISRQNKETRYNGAIDKLSSVSIDSSDAFRMKMLGSKQQISEIISEVYDDGSCDVKRSRDELLFLLLFLGIDTTEICVLEKTDLDSRKKELSVKWVASRSNDKTMQVVVNDIEQRTYKVESDIVALWEKCSEATELESANGKGGYNIRELQDTPYLFRNVESANADKIVSTQSLRTIVDRIFNQYKDNTGIELKVSIGNIKISGIFYRMYLEEKEGQEITNEYMASKFNMSFADRNELVAKTRSYMIDYQNWKRAFGHK